VRLLPPLMMVTTVEVLVVVAWLLNMMLGKTQQVVKLAVVEMD
jgi:hypothetical protein